MVDCCFKQGCDLETQYVCLCLSSITKCCEFHLQAHLKSPNIHILVPLVTEPSEETKDTFLEFLVIEKLNKEKLKNAFLTSCIQNWNDTKNSIEASLKSLDSDLKKYIDNYSYLIEKISQISEKEARGLNKLMQLSDTDFQKVIMQCVPTLNIKIPINDSKRSARAKLHWRLSLLKKNKSKILNRVNNDLETEQDYRKVCTFYKSKKYNLLLSQAYQECINAYQKITSTYLVDGNHNLYIYDTENEREEVKVLELKKDIESIDLITQLPNGELFVIGSSSYTMIAFIIDGNYNARNLIISNPKNSWQLSIYCFGGGGWSNRYSGKKFYYSKRFDLDENRWIKLAQTPLLYSTWYEIYCLDSIIFNDNILISISGNSNLLLYSINIDSFSEIPYKFAKDTRKILINAEQNLYLIECDEDGFIYQNEAENLNAWKPIAKSLIAFRPRYVYCSYNKGGIYISISCLDKREHFKFDLSKKSLIDIAYYSKHITIKRTGKNLECEEYFWTNVKDGYNTWNYTNNEYSLYQKAKIYEPEEKYNPPEEVE